MEGIKMKSFFGLLLIALLVYSLYVENQSRPSALLAEQQGFDQLIDIEEGDPGEVPVEHYPGPNVGDRALDFTLKTTAGKTVTLSELRGKKVILNFWATWCPPCKDEIPIFQEFHDKQKEDVTMLAVNIDPQYNVKQYEDNMGITFPVLLDEDDKINSAYDILTVPTTFIIDEKGVIIHKKVGAFTSLEELEKATD